MNFFFNDTATTEIYTLSLHDALPISGDREILAERVAHEAVVGEDAAQVRVAAEEDRKSTRLNSSHQIISYAVFCLKKKNTNTTSSESTKTNHTISVPDASGGRCI